MKIRTYREMKQYDSLQERYEYLKLGGEVGYATFGFDRHLNQTFYKSREWQDIRRFVISRDLGCDLGVDGYDIYSGLLIHHMNPITPDDIVGGNRAILDPDFLITTTHDTHNAIHYGDDNQLPKQLVERHPGDTKLW